MTDQTVITAGDCLSAAVEAWQRGDILEAERWCLMVERACLPWCGVIDANTPVQFNPPGAH